MFREAWSEMIILFVEGDKQTCYDGMIRKIEEINSKNGQE
jgi:hypothetical protein